MLAEIKPNMEDLVNKKIDEINKIATKQYWNRKTVAGSSNGDIAS